MESHERESHAPILAAFSPWSAARDPVEFGLAASRLTGAPLVVVTVRHGGPVVSELGGDVADSPEEARTLEHLRLELQRRGRRDVKVRVLGARTTGAGLARAVEELKPQLVVFGSSDRGKVGSVLLGSTAERIIHTGACPVAVVPKGYQRPEAGVVLIGVGFAPTREGTEALRAAAVLARGRDVRLRAIVAVDPHQVDEPTGSLAESLAGSRHHAMVEATVREALGELATDTALDVEVRVEDPADALIAASRDVGLLVVGARGRGARTAALLGSVSRKVAAHAACPVLILPAGASRMSDVLISDAARA